MTSHDITWLSHDPHMISHDFHVTFTWSSHDITWFSHDFTWLSHDFHMTFTWSSHDITWLSHDPHPPRWTVVTWRACCSGWWKWATLAWTSSTPSSWPSRSSRMLIPSWTSSKRPTTPAWRGRRKCGEEALTLRMQSGMQELSLLIQPYVVPLAPLVPLHTARASLSHGRMVLATMLLPQELRLSQPWRLVSTSPESSLPSNTGYASIFMWALGHIALLYSGEFWHRHTHTHTCTQHFQEDATLTCKVEELLEHATDYPLCMPNEKSAIMEVNRYVYTHGPLWCITV